MAPQRTRLAAYGWAASDGLVLLTKIAAGHHGADQWTLPGGGIEWGEHPEDALLRELHEETGLTGTIEDFLGIDSIVHGPNDHNGYTDLHVIRLVFSVHVTGNPEVQEVDGSTSDAAWLPLTNIDSLPHVDLVATGRRMAAGDYAFRAAATGKG